MRDNECGGSSRTGDEKKEIVGRYLWARLGLFDFSSPEVQQRVQQSFCQWLDKTAPHVPGLSPELLAQLKKSSETWNRPEQFAEFDIPFARLPQERPDGRIHQVRLGRAFMMDPSTPGWSGVCKVNQVPPEVWNRAEGALMLGSHSGTPSVPAPDATKLEPVILEQSLDPRRSLRERIHHATAGQRRPILRHGTQRHTGRTNPTPKGHHHAQKGKAPLDIPAANHAFGWRSGPAVKRIHEAVAQIRKAAKSDPLTAADSAVLDVQGT